MSPTIKYKYDCNSFLGKREDASIINLKIWFKLIQLLYQTGPAFKNKIFSSLVIWGKVDESHSNLILENEKSFVKKASYIIIIR